MPPTTPKRAHRMLDYLTSKRQSRRLHHNLVRSRREKNATPLGGEDKDAIRKAFRPKSGPVCSAFFSLMDFNDD